MGPQKRAVLGPVQPRKPLPWEPGQSAHTPDGKDSVLEILKPQSRRVTMYVVAALALVLLGLIIPYAINSKSKPKPKAQSNASTSHATAKTAPTGNVRMVPFGGAANDGSFKIQLLGVTPNPTVTGTPPDTGTEYIEADFLVTSISGRNTLSFNVYYMSTEAPSGNAAGNVELNTVDNSAGTTNPITFATIPPKAVQIPGKTSVVQPLDFPENTSNTTATVYALFEVRPGDKSYISWQEAAGPVYEFRYPAPGGS